MDSREESKVAVLKARGGKGQHFKEMCKAALTDVVRSKHVQRQSLEENYHLEEGEEEVQEE